MEELGEAEGEDTGDVEGSPEEKSVCEESKKEGEDEEGVGAEFLVGVDEAEKDADVFDEGGADEVGAENVEEEEGGIDEEPDDQPAPIDGANAL